MSYAIVALALAALASPFLIYVACWYIRDRSEERAANIEFGDTPLARRLRVDLPYLAAGSYHQAARHVIRTGPLFPADLDGARAAELCDMCGRAGPHTFSEWARENAQWMTQRVAEAAQFAGHHGLATAWAGSYEMDDAA